MRTLIIVLSCAFTCLLAQQTGAAVKFKRFPACPDGLVSAKTCECHAGTTGKYEFCHKGQYCHTFAGFCHS